MADPLTVVLCVAREGGADQLALERQLTDALAALPDVKFAVLPNLYDLGPDGPGVRFLQSVPGNLAVLGWLYPRAAYWVLHANGLRGRMGHTSLFPDEELEPAGSSHLTETLDRTLWCLDLRGHGAEDIFEEVHRLVGETAGPAATSHCSNADVAHDGKSHIDEAVLPRWYPVIDHRRCVNCLECLNFCLFGAFGLDDAGRIFVEQPDACRDGCPACSRICPTGAILFPQHSDPAIAGDPNARVANAPFDAIQMLGGRDAGDLAEFERRQALSAREATDTPMADDPPPKDALDRLVDELDQTDL